MTEIKVSAPFIKTSMHFTVFHIFHLNPQDFPWSHEGNSLIKILKQINDHVGFPLTLLLHPASLLPALSHPPAPVFDLFFQRPNDVS